MQTLTILRLITAGSLTALVGCGPTAGIGGTAPAATSIAAPTSASTATAVPMPGHPAAATFEPAAPAAVPASSPQPRPATQALPITLPITPLFPLGAAGTITVVSSSTGDHYHVTVTGLAAGSVHTIHDHAGSCASASRSTHLAVLATVAADGHGVIVFDATVPSFDFGAGRIVIVYNSARPIFITGCATL